MKTSLLFVLCWLTVRAVSADDVVPSLTVDGVTYSNVTFNTASATAVTIFHSKGVASVPLAQLSPELQKRFGVKSQDSVASPTSPKGLYDATIEQIDARLGKPVSIENGERTYRIGKISIGVDDNKENAYRIVTIVNKKDDGGDNRLSDDDFQKYIKLFCGEKQLTPVDDSAIISNVYTVDRTFTLVIFNPQSSRWVTLRKGPLAAPSAELSNLFKSGDRRIITSHISSRSYPGGSMWDQRWEMGTIIVNLAYSGYPWMNVRKIAQHRLIEHWKHTDASITVSRSELPLLAEHLDKFTRWAAESRKHGLNNLTKEVGKVGTLTLTLKIETDTPLLHFNNTVMRDGYEKCFMNEKDVSEILLLLLEVPKLEGEIEEDIRNTTRSREEVDKILR